MVNICEPRAGATVLRIARIPAWACGETIAHIGPDTPEPKAERQATTTVYVRKRTVRLQQRRAETRAPRTVLREYPSTTACS